MNQWKQEEKLPQQSHNVVMEDRKRMVLSGVLDVVAFEEDNVQLKTVLGDLTVRGSGMKMESYHSEVGDLIMHGNIYALVYTNDTGRKEGFFARLLK